MTRNSVSPTTKPQVLEKAPTTPGREYHNLVNELDTDICQLRNMLNDLHNRLEPFLSLTIPPNSYEPPKKSPVEPPKAMAILSHMSEAIREEAAKLEDLLSRLEL